MEKYHTSYTEDDSVYIHWLYNIHFIMAPLCFYVLHDDVTTVLVT